VRDATDSGTERALIPSPQNSTSRESVTYADEYSDFTETERIVEEQSKHVKFKDTPSELSVREWTNSGENESREEARVHDLSTGGGSGW
jgi:hypothetical protein